MGKNDIVILGLLGVGIYALSKIVGAKQPEQEPVPYYEGGPGASPTGGYSIRGGEDVPHYYPPSTLKIFEDIGLKELPTVIRATEAIKASGAPLKPVIMPGGKWIE